MTPELKLPRYIKTADVTRMLGEISRESLRALVRDGVLSPPVELTRRLQLWDLGEINRVMEQRRRAA